MKALAWDTSSKAGALVALEWDAASRTGWDSVRLVSEWTLNVDATHSESLLWGIHQMLESARWKISDVDVFGVGMGPGSFTGLRIGVTTARTLSHTLGKPLVGVSSLAALARPAAAWLADSGTILVATTDACKGELFSLWGAAKGVRDCVALADGDSPGLWKRGVEEKVLSPEALMTQVRKKIAGGGKKLSWAVVGEGRLRYLEDWKALPRSREVRIPDFFRDQVQGRALGQLVWEAAQAGLARDPLTVHPRYVRASDAELKLKAGLLKAAPQEPALSPDTPAGHA